MLYKIYKTQKENFVYKRFAKFFRRNVCVLNSVWVGENLNGVDFYHAMVLNAL